MSLHPETSAITAGRPDAAPDASLNPPLIISSTYHAGGPVGYGRYGNESWSALETAIGELEGGATLSFSSGMAAISAVFSILPIGAPIVASNQGYSGVMGLLNQFQASGRLEVRFVEITNTDEVIAAVGLENKTGALIRNLSGGQRRRLDVALGIIGSPELLFLDEPTTGFDPEARRAFWALIEQLRGDGTTILLTTHYLDEAEALADRVAVINNGLIVEVSTPAELGGRATSKALVSWRDGSQVKTEESDNPTSVVTRLTTQFGGEIPELTVTRPSLEDIYLKMIGGVHEQDS